MGKSYQGAYGNYTGKVGNVIARKSNGRTVLAIYQPIVKNPQTTKQMSQRTKFTMLSKFASKIGIVLYTGFKQSGVNTTVYNRFIKKNFEDAISGTYPNFELLYNKIAVANGILEMPYSPSASIDSGSLQVSWTDNTGEGKATATDEAVLLVFNAAKEAALANLSGGSRSDGLATLTLPSAWSGDSCDVWMFMRSEDNELVSNSVYLGNFSI